MASFSDILGSWEDDRKLREKMELAQATEAMEERHRLLKAMNERHAVISNVDGKCLVADLVPPPFQTVPLTLMSFAEFKRRYPGRVSLAEVYECGYGEFRAEGLYVTAPIGQEWLGWIWQRKYEGLVFAPGWDLTIGNGEGVFLNLWRTGEQKPELWPLALRRIWKASQAGPPPTPGRRGLRVV